MAQLLFTVTLFLLCFSIPLPAFSQSGFNPYPDYSCPDGFIPLPRYSQDPLGDPRDPPDICDEDKCYNETIGCGPGNGCTMRKASSIARFFYERECQCNPPYVKAVNPGIKGVGATTSCYIPGQGQCDPNPCQNGGSCYGVRIFTSDCSSGDTCRQDFNGDFIDFQCGCKSGFFGTTCSFPYASSTAKPVLKDATANPPPNPPPSGSQGAQPVGGTACDPNSTLPNQCFNADGSYYVCCPGQCPDNPGANPACA